MLLNVAALFLLLPAVFAAPAAGKPKPGDIVPGQYIIVMKDDISASDFSAHKDWVGKKHGKGGITIEAFQQTYEMEKFKGYAGKFDDASIEEIASRPEVAYVEPDKVVSANSMVSQPSAPWGLARISHRSKGYTTYYYDSSAGYGIYAYVIDTGILTTHSQFGGRASTGANFVTYETATDKFGHGTHVTGTIIGTTFGVAKRAKAVSVKVLDAKGNGWSSTTMAGVQWAVRDARAKNRIGKSVVNMSLEGPFSSSLNNAVNAAVSAGIPIAVAAGNHGVNAGTISPASAASALTTGATDISDVRAWFSNYGSAIDFFAPGVNIQSAWIGSNSATSIQSGTSMACPHVAGVAAYLMSKEGIRTPSSLRSRMRNIATVGKVTGITGSYASPNVLLYNGSGH